MVLVNVLVKLMVLADLIEVMICLVILVMVAMKALAILVEGNDCFGNSEGDDDDDGSVEFDVEINDAYDCMMIILMLWIILMVCNPCFW